MSADTPAPITTQPEELCHAVNPNTPTQVFCEREKGHVGFHSGHSPNALLFWNEDGSVPQPVGSDQAADVAGIGGIGTSETRGPNSSPEETRIARLIAERDRETELRRQAEATSEDLMRDYDARHVYADEYDNMEREKDAAKAQLAALRTHLQALARYERQLMWPAHGSHLMTTDPENPERGEWVKWSDIEGVLKENP